MFYLNDFYYDEILISLWTSIFQPHVHCGKFNSGGGEGEIEEIEKSVRKKVVSILCIIAFQDMFPILAQQHISKILDIIL
jgi:hypothetical protein